MSWTVTVGGTAKITYSEEEAKRVIAGYAFGEVPLEWSSPRRTRVADAPSTVRRGKWAYRTFDCVRPSAGAISAADIALSAALGSRIGSAAILGIEAVAGELATILGRIPPTRTFWGLPEDDLGSDPPDENSKAWPLWQAWELLMGVPYVEATITHKTLHHLRPKVFPMLDSLTLHVLGHREAWRTVHRELVTQAARFDELEAWFAELAAERRGEPLSRLRIHDILVWGDRHCDRALLLEHGAPYASSAEGGPGGRRSE